MKKIKWTDLFIFIVFTELVGAVSALLSGSFRDFYSELLQPPLSPPGAVFPVVWAILYALMGISAYLVWSSDTDELSRSLGLKLYYAQLALNFSWSIIFFRFRLLSLAVIVAALLLAVVGAMILVFSRIKSLAAKLNIPYFLWLCFALYLALGVWSLNR